MVTGGRVLGESRLSPDGTLVAIVASGGGKSAQLVTVPVGGGCEVVLTTEPSPGAARADGGGMFDWLPDGSALVYAAVDGGLWCQPAAGGPARPVAARHAAGPAAAPAVSPDGTQVAYVVDQRHVAVASLDELGPWPIRLSTGADFTFDPAWSPDGATVAWHEWDVPAMPWDASRIVLRAADGTGEVTVVAGGEGTAVAQPRFGPDGRLGFLCDQDGWCNLWVAEPGGADARPLVAAATEHGPASWGQGIRSWAWSPDGSQVAWRTNDDGFSRLLIAPVDRTDQPRVLAKGVHHGLSWRGEHVAAVRTGARTPTQVVTYDVATGERTTVARGPVAGWEALDLPEPEVLRWAGDDGAEVVGRLFLPSVARGAGRGGAAAAPPPLLCWIHGGPTDQWLVRFDARHAYFLERGWAIFVPDHRGSTGHGRAYTQAMAGRWGELDVADCAAGLRHLVAERLVDPDRIVAMGSSAGGFTALLLLAHHPVLCSAGVALSAVADLVDLANRSHRFEAHYTRSLVGPLPAARQAHVDRSPLTLASSIRAPVLLLHGDADEVVPVEQARALAAELTRLGRDVELHEYPGEGHGWGRPEVVADELARIDRFLARHVPDH